VLEGEIMRDPFEQELPEKPLDKATAFARGLAYGVAEGWWTSIFQITHRVNGMTAWDLVYSSDYQDQMFENKLSVWMPFAPSLDLLEMFGYLILREGHFYQLTPKAMALLERPAIPPSIFICYRREQSSAFAMLIEARLKSRGVQAFIDKEIRAGAQWEDLLKTTIQERATQFICVIGQKTLESDYVRQEIHWAHEAGRYMIPIWHGGFTRDDPLPEDEVVRSFVESRNAIKVGEESALNYDNAINQLLNELEFTVTPDIDLLRLP
jgi:hypothetical protein